MTPACARMPQVLLCVRNAQQLLKLESLDSAGLVWPTQATDMTAAVFPPTGVPVVCRPGAMRVGNDLRRVGNLVCLACY